MPSKVIGKVADHLVGQIKATTRGQPSDNASPNVVVRGKNRGRDATAKSASQFTPKPCKPFNIPIACEDYLLPGSVQTIDCALQFEEGGPLANKKMKVINCQQIDRTTTPPKPRQASASQGLKKVRGELLSREDQCSEFRTLLPGMTADGCEEMALPDTRRTIQQHR
jgi:hypothetical protein